MNEKEIAEIRRRYRSDKSNISRVRGCYVNDGKKIVSEFNESLGLMAPEESEKLLTIIKKTLSGSLGKNLLNIEFETNQVLNSEEHKLLMTLRNSSLGDEEAVQEFYKKIIETLQIEGHFLILLTYDQYDVPSYSKDGEKEEESSEVFSYFLCSICPVKLTKPALSYYTLENKFKNIVPDWAISVPELGFMFPTFDDRSANIYNALYFTRNTSESHNEFVDAVFKREVPMPATAQKEAFESILSDTVAEECSLEVVQAVHEQLTELIEEHKASKENEPLLVSKETVIEVLESCGVPEEKVTAFENSFDTEFGADAAINPNNIIDSKKFEVSTEDVKIRVNPGRTDLIQTRVIDGVKYILIRADENIEVNGVNIRIQQ